MRGIASELYAEPATAPYQSEPPRRLRVKIFENVLGVMMVVAALAALYGVGWLATYYPGWAVWLGVACLGALGFYYISRAVRWVDAWLTRVVR